MYGQKSWPPANSSASYGGRLLYGGLLYLCRPSEGPYYAIPLCYYTEFNPIIQAASPDSGQSGPSSRTSSPQPAPSRRTSSPQPGPSRHTSSPQPGPSRRWTTAQLRTRRALAHYRRSTVIYKYVYIHTHQVR